MDNHVHFIVIPRRADSLAEVFKLLNTRYSHYVNRKMENCGHLWQGRFYSCIVDGPHLLSTLKYVERNPVRAGMTIFPWDWELSSARENIGERRPYFDGEDFQDYIGMAREEWKLFIATPEKNDSAHTIRKNTRSGLPLVTDACLEKLKITLGLTRIMHE
jgi:putative transposase